jgi:hypothetical protein
MSMSDARQFAELSARVTRLESLVQELADRTLGKDVQDEVLGPAADSQAVAEDRAARDGFRNLLERGGVTVAAERKLPSGGPPGADNPIETPGVDYPKPPEDKPLNGGLRDKLAALQGGEAVPAKPQADPRDAHHDARRPSEPRKA